MTTVAFIGLGAMGLPMARRLATTPGVELAAYDLDATRLEELSGAARRAGSVADAADGAELVFSALPADAHVRAVAADLRAMARPGQTLIELSTIAPATIEAVALDLAGVGVATVSAGMTGSTVAAADGTLRLFVGGAAIPDRLRPAVDAVASELLDVGSAGAAKALKLVNNMVIGTLDCAIAEALALGEQLGLTLEQVAEALATHGADSWTLRTLVIPRTLADDLGPGTFSTTLMIKDMRLYSTFAAQRGRPSLFAGLATSFYRGASAHGYADHFHPIVVRWFERGANLGGRPVTQAGEPQDIARQIAAGVAAVQALVSVEAIDALADLDVDPALAVSLLRRGSARNDALTSPPAPADQLLADLDAIAALAHAADVPATLHEVARHVALGRSS